MFMFRTSWLTVIAAVATTCLTPACLAASESLDEQFAQIQKSIEANCAECYRASKDDFVHAVGELEALIAAGFNDPAAAKLLAQAYRTWAFTYSEDSGESEMLRHKERAIYGDLIKKVPEDASIWAGYAQSLDDPMAGLQALKRAESLSQDDASIQFSLGMLYAHGLSELKQGVAHLERAIALEQHYAKLTYGEQLARVLESTGNRTRAAKVRGDMKAFKEELEGRDRSNTR